MEQYNLTYTGAELDSAIGRASEGFAKADEVTQEMEQLIAEVETKLENGDLTGPRGPSGVYVGSGEMPEGYNVQIDPNGSGSCYTAGESDSRYANAITGEAAGKVANLTDAWAGGVLSKCEISGQEVGVTPSKLSASGKNLLGLNQLTHKISIGTTYEILNNNTILVTINRESGNYSRSEFSTAMFHYLKGRELTISADISVSGSNRVLLRVSFKKSGTNDIEYNVFSSPGYTVFTVPDEFDEAYVIFFSNYESTTAKKGDTATYTNIQIELGSTRTAYEPYAGAEYTLPELAPLYSLNDVCDTYDTATGVETRQLGKDEDGSLYELESPVVTQHDPIAVTVPTASANIFADAGEVSVTYTKDTNKVITALTERIAALEGEA